MALLAWCCSENGKITERKSDEKDRSEADGAKEMREVPKSLIDSWGERRLLDVASFAGSVEVSDKCVIEMNEARQSRSDFYITMSVVGAFSRHRGR